jgi:hypothetical protein
MGIEKEKIECIPEDLSPETYKDDLIKMKKSIMYKLIEMELETKKSSEWSINKVKFFYKLIFFQIVKEKHLPSKAKKKDLANFSQSLFA